MQGRDFDIAKEASKHPIKFNTMLTRKFGETGNVKLVKNCVQNTAPRISCGAMKGTAATALQVERNDRVTTATTSIAATD